MVFQNSSSSVKMTRRLYLEDLKERVAAIEKHLNQMEFCEETREQAISNPIPIDISLIVKRYFELPPTEREVLLNVICDNEEKKEQIRSYATIYQSSLVADNLRKESELLRQDIDLLIVDAKNLRSALKGHRSDKSTGSLSREGKERPQGELIPEAVLKNTLLQVLADMGGLGKVKMILDEMEVRLGNRLTDADKERLEDNEPRWRKKTQWLRFNLKEEGVLKADSPRGIWELSNY